MTQFGEWSYTLEVQYLPASMGLDVIPSASHMCSLKVHGHITLPTVFSHLVWMLWWMSMAEVITSH